MQALCQTSMRPYFASTRTTRTASKSCRCDDSISGSLTANANLETRLNSAMIETACLTVTGFLRTYLQFLLKKGTRKATSLNCRQSPPPPLHLMSIN